MRNITQFRSRIPDHSANHPHDAEFSILREATFFFLYSCAHFCRLKMSVKTFEEMNFKNSITIKQHKHELGRLPKISVGGSRSLLGFQQDLRAN